MKILLITTLVYLITACSTTITGPITKKKYKLNIGCTSDMEHYKEDREKVIKDIDDKTPDIDCPTEDKKTP